MMTQETEKVRKQMQIVCIDDLVPQNLSLIHILTFTIVPAFDGSPPSSTVAPQIFKVFP